MKIVNILHLLFIPMIVIALPVEASEGRKKAKTTLGRKSPRRVVTRQKIEKDMPEKAEVAPIAVAEEIVGEVRKDLESATNDAAKAITECTIAKNHARRSLALGLITQEAADTAIKKEDQKIVQIQQGLKGLIEQTLQVADESEKQASSVQQFISGARRLGAQGLAKASSYIGYSEEDKKLARAIIAELEQLKKTENNPAIKEEIDKEIYAQKLITGQEWSTQKYLLLGAVSTAALVAGVSLGAKLLTTPPVEEKTQFETMKDTAQSLVEGVGQKIVSGARTVGKHLRAGMVAADESGEFKALGGPTLGEVVGQGVVSAGQSIGTGISRSVQGAEERRDIPQDLQDWQPSHPSSEKGGQVLGSMLKSGGKTFVTGVGQEPQSEYPSDTDDAMRLTRPGSQELQKNIAERVVPAGQAVMQTVGSIPGYVASIAPGIESEQFKLPDFSALGQSISTGAKAVAEGAGNAFKEFRKMPEKVTQDKTKVTQEETEEEKITQDKQRQEKQETPFERQLREQQEVDRQLAEDSVGIVEATKRGARWLSQKASDVGAATSEFMSQMPQREPGWRPEASVERDLAHEASVAAIKTAGTAGKTGLEFIGKKIQEAGPAVQEKAEQIAEDREERRAAFQEEKVIMEQNRIADEERKQRRADEAAKRKAERARKKAEEAGVKTEYDTSDQPKE